MDTKVNLKNGGNFSYIIVNQDFSPSSDGNTLYIISLSAELGDDGISKRGTHVTERSIQYILEKLPQIEFVRCYFSTKEVALIFEKALLKILDKRVIIPPNTSKTVKIK